eukprot:scaffold1157_cov122-Cylindrotheca_fusiformis.AAC.13
MTDASVTTMKHTVFSNKILLQVCLALFLLTTSHVHAALSDDETALFAAIGSDDLDGLLRLIREKGVDINTRGPGNQTPLMHSVLKDDEKFVKALLEEGADVTIDEKDGYTPMHGAGFQGRAAIAKLLIDQGLDPFDMHRDGYIGFHRACWGTSERHAETVQVFLDAGVPHDFESKDLKTCKSMTRNRKTVEILKQAEEKASLSKDKNEEL